MLTHTILGAGGPIGNGLAKELIANRQKLKLVSRNPTLIEGAEVYPADITDLKQTVDAVNGSDIVYLCVGLKYDYAVWRIQWPRIMDNVIEACHRAGSKLIFFDNVYMYGKVEGPMTEDTPYQPCSRKGDLRARIATTLMSAVRKDYITASIARAADFYGPDAGKSGVPNMLIFSNFASAKAAQYLVNPNTRHSYTYTPDAAKALYLLGMSKDSWNQVWHLPTAVPPLTGNEFMQLAATAMGVKPKMTVLHPWMLKLVGIFNKTIAEVYEMRYQHQFDYIFDSSKFEKAFGFIPTPYAEGIAATAQFYMKKRSEQGFKSGN